MYISKSNLRKIRAAYQAGELSLEAALGMLSRAGLSRDVAIIWIARH